MLLIDGEKISAKDFCIRFGIDYNKVSSKPSFELDKKHQNKKGGKMSSPAAMMYRTKFHATDKHGNNVEIRYAKTASPKTHKTGHVETVYRPRYVGFKAMTASFKKDEELAVFMFVNPKNKFSPFRNQHSPKPDYEFVDGQMRAIEKIKTLDNLAEAMAHAKKVSGHELEILCRGLKIGSVDMTEEDSVRAALMEYASKNPKNYLESVAQGLVIAEGRVRYLVSKGIFTLKRQANSRWWEWASGERDGERIGNIITNSAQDATQSLINYINANLGEYRDLIRDVTETFTARETAKQVLASQQEVVSLDLEDSVEADDDLLSLIEGHSAVIKYVQSKGYKAAPVALKGLKEAVRSGDVTSDNIDLYLQNNFNAQD